MTSPLNVSVTRGGALCHLRLNRPKANIIDGEMIAALNGAIEAHSEDRDLKAFLVSAEGPNFSFGASVQEHLPDRCADMLGALHGLLLRMVECETPILAAVQGQCLGGGFELAMACSLIFAAPDACFGQPEIKLGLIAPAASCLLPELVGPVHASDILLSGRALDAEEARRIGVVLDIAEDPLAAVEAYVDAHLVDKSAAALRVAMRAVRSGLVRRMRERIAEVEAIYLDDLMSTHDAIEGLNAFIEKRPAQWENR
jgi:cyclohexa-1,5-dienecarbonyl-CoA hydratase